MSIANLVTSATHFPTPHVIHGDYFHVRIFGNGNLHLWFERKDLLVEVNKLLAEYYGEVIGDGYDTTEAAETSDYHMTPAKNFGAFMSSEDVAAWVIQYAQIGKGMMALEPCAGTGVLATAAVGSGTLDNCLVFQPALAHEH